MPLDPAFTDDCLYDLDGLLIDEIVEINREESMVRARMPTHEDLPLTRRQRVDPELHPRHVSGGLMIHMTGMIAFVHFYYVLDLRHSEGWTGYGVRIHSARFKNLARPGVPLILECRATRSRRIRNTITARYAFTFTQDDKLVYEGDQTALWTKVR